MSRFLERLSVAAFCAALILLAAPAAQAKIICGGKAGDTCGKGQYCYHSPGTCREKGAQGACKTRPKGCTREYRPVCGCDGKTYPNACTAAAAGVSVLKEGKCIGGFKAPTRPPELDRRLTTPLRPGDVNVCGGIAGKRCKRGYYCHFKAGTCHIADRQGACSKLPRACTREYRPVCACNGKTYANACLAAMAGMSIRHTGECRSLNRLKQRP